MDHNDSRSPIRNPRTESQQRSAARREEWVLEAVRHLFAEAMADRRR